MAEEETQNRKTERSDVPARATSDRAERRAARKGTAVQQSEDGVTIIHDGVVAKIASVAVREVQGVYRLVAQGTGQQLAAMARSVSGSEDRESGVAVEVGEEETAIDVRIITEYGASIPQVAEAIRRNISDRIESMTGLRTVEINVEVTDLYFGEDEAEEGQEARSRQRRVQ